MTWPATSAADRARHRNSMRGENSMYEPIRPSRISIMSTNSVNTFVPVIFE